MGKKEFLVHLYVTENQVLEIKQVADIKTEAVGLLMLRLGIADAFYARVDDLELFGIHIDDELFTWKRASWI